MSLRNKIFITVLLLSIISAYAILIEPNIILIKNITIKDSKLAATFKDIKVVHISDLDIESIGYREKSFVNKINELNADIIFFTGDFVSNGNSDYHNAITIMKGLKNRDRIWAVMGDSDYWIKMRDSSRLIKELRNLGIHVLINESDIITLKNGYKLAISGINHMIYKKFNMKPFLAKMPVEIPVVLLTHSVETVINNLNVIFSGELPGKNVNLVLSGHSHGGQIIFPWWKFFPYKIYESGISNYIKGSHSFKGIPIYINSGIGLSHVPFRFMVPPEIALLEFTI